MTTTTSDPRTRETVTAAFDLAKSHAGHRWEDIGEVRSRRWSTLVQAPTKAGVPAELDDELQDAFDVLLSKEEIRRRGSKSLAALKEELGLGA